MVTPDDVVRIYQLLEEHGIALWLTGGWGIDALLGQNTRPHKDLDIFVLVNDVVRLNALLGEQGYQLVKLWSENLSTTDSSWNKIETGYVLGDGAGRELDVHALRLDSLGNGFPAWKMEAGFFFTPGDLSGAGTVNGHPVRCQSAANQLLCHTGYKLPEYQWGDLDKLHEKFGVEFPAEISSQRAGKSLI
jgi:lincosamide nucleotidyltransferase A/C/D/E